MEEKSDPHSEVVIWLPPFHDMGLIGGVLTPIFAGAQVTLMSPLTFLKRPLLWLQTLSDQKAHVSGGPNFGYQYCVRKISEEQAATLDHGAAHYNLGVMIVNSSRKVHVS